MKQLTQAVKPRRPRHRYKALVLLAATPVLLGAANPGNFPDPSHGSSTFGSGTSAVSLNTDAPYGLIQPAGIGSLIDSSYSLADLDPVTGTLLGADITTTATDAYLLANDISDSSFLALDTAELARTSLEQAERARKEQAAAPAGEHGVGPDGCPTSAPANTLREGAANIGIATLCENSVAQAPHEYAALAIKHQLNNIGEIYSQPKRMQKGHSDCSSMAMRSYDAAGLNILVNNWAPNTTAIRGSKWATRIPHNQTLPGDLIFPFPGHVATKLSDGYMVHNNRTGDVSHVKKAYKKTYYNVRVNPDKLSKK